MRNTVESEEKDAARGEGHESAVMGESEAELLSVCDVAIVGDSLTGLSVAYECAKLGLRVVFVESAGAEAARAGGGAFETVLHDTSSSIGETLLALCEPVRAGAAQETAAPEGSLQAGGRSQHETASHRLAAPPATDSTHLPAHTNEWFTPVPAPLPHLADARGASHPLHGANLYGLTPSIFSDWVRALIGSKGQIRAYLDRILPVLKIGKETYAYTLVRKRLGKSYADRIFTPLIEAHYGCSANNIETSVCCPGLNEAITRRGSLTAALEELRESRHEKTWIQLAQSPETILARAHEKLSFYKVEHLRGQEVVSIRRETLEDEAAVSETTGAETVAAEGEILAEGGARAVGESSTAGGSSSVAGTSASNQTESSQWRVELSDEHAGGHVLYARALVLDRSGANSFTERTDHAVRPLEPAHPSLLAAYTAKLCTGSASETAAARDTGVSGTQAVVAPQVQVFPLYARLQAGRQAGNLRIVRSAAGARAEVRVGSRAGQGGVVHGGSVFGGAGARDTEIAALLAECDRVLQAQGLARAHEWALVHRPAPLRSLAAVREAETRTAYAPSRPLITGDYWHGGNLAAALTSARENAHHLRRALLGFTDLTDHSSAQKPTQK